MTDCAQIAAAHLGMQVRRSDSLGVTPGTQVFVYGLPSPFNEGFQVVVLADERTGSLSLSYWLDGEQVQQIDLATGSALLWTIRQSGAGFATEEVRRVDARPWPIGGGTEGALQSVAASRRLLGTHAPILFWDLNDPALRDSIVASAQARGYDVRVLPMSQMAMYGAMTRPCRPGEVPGPIAPPPAPPGPGRATPGLTEEKRVGVGTVVVGLAGVAIATALGYALWRAR